MNLRRRIPLILTVFRFALAPLFVVAHRGRWGVAPLLAIVVLAILTDWLDGFLARRLDAVSVWGKLLDPFADALFCMVVFWEVYAAGAGLLPLWVLCLLLAREALVTFVFRPLALLRGVVMAASWIGKLKTVTQFTVIVAFVLLQAGMGEAALAWVARIGFYVVLALSLASGALYGRGVIGALRHPVARED